MSSSPVARRSSMGRRPSGGLPRQPSMQPSQIAQGSSMRRSSSLRDSPGMRPVGDRSGVQITTPKFQPSSIEGRSGSFSRRAKSPQIQGKSGALGGSKGDKRHREEEARAQAMERPERIEREYEAELFMLAETTRRDQQENEDMLYELVEQRRTIRTLTRELDETKQSYAAFQEKTNIFEEEMQRQLTRLTIERHELQEKVTAFDLVRAEMEQHTGDLLAQVSALEQKVRDSDIVRHGIQHDASVMEQNLKRALNTARRENLSLRMTHAAQEREIASRLEDAGAELQALTERIEAAIEIPLQERCDAANLLDDSLDLIRIRYQDLLQQCRMKATRFSSELIKVSSLHSNIPEYVKQKLALQTDDELRRLIDTLAFDESVRQYLEALFAPPFELDADGEMRRVFRCPDTPSAVLASGDLFVIGQRPCADASRARPAPPFDLASPLRPKSVPPGNALVPLRGSPALHRERPSSGGVGRSSGSATPQGSRLPSLNPQ
eukprot:TRINITY_DN410_c0_g1_i1.p1 TRINITY_DN410_c0_g1~~TRINITY_DN410_c0_g1_i1.p1  ORF type:complete len:494 (+),score=82.45 TRINITY_DN410_c0_g1_i1:61-1542(+)